MGLKTSNWGLGDEIIDKFNVVIEKVLNCGRIRNENSITYTVN